MATQLAGPGHLGVGAGAQYARSRLYMDEHGCEAYKEDVDADGGK